MSTKLYPNDYFGDDKDINLKEQQISEQQWLIKEIILPELPAIRECIETCLDLLNSPEEFTLALTTGSHNTTSANISNTNLSSLGGSNERLDIESNTSGSSSNSNSAIGTVRGTLRRQGVKLVSLQAEVSMVQFRNGKSFPLCSPRDTKGFVLEQLEHLVQRLEAGGALLDNLSVTDTTLEAEVFATGLMELQRLLTGAAQLLQRPPSKLAFPLCGPSAGISLCGNIAAGNYNSLAANDTRPSLYSNSNSNNKEELALEAVVAGGELSVDIRVLEPITKPPWNSVDPLTGRSLSDQLKDKLRDRGTSLEKALNECGVTIAHSWWENYTGSANTTTLQVARDHMSRGVTWNDRAVLIRGGTLHVAASDPVLVTVDAKLGGLEACVAAHCSNLAALQ
ncbi:hypothetical protein TBLA_0H00780 [Henningerozyma blattae CBS 6284]|uniref:Uncharacterized protein n=1 Tax=Henningerozyma blattae (strain ATCC 34711 / CBS 6284 / DSM 70876 / NBRC 10599 / NRRL Y-10934 / UCD 77-7) TaxID=1071380 RepID=I2H7L5_HENB6|nr:hypothetical protein TBLA_0H00780 [Tetrapisispora blattae CBS 6284]CCH62367.1 hypothetical protein TBLA_0H00780 [Tetrapisispora blattae CBS 6284]